MHFTSLSSEFLETVLVTFVDATSITYIISSQTITDLSTKCFKCLLFSQTGVLSNLHLQSH